MPSLLGDFNQQQFTDAGAPAAGYRLYTYAAGTTTKKTAYTDAAGNVPHVYTSDGMGGEYIALNPRGEADGPLMGTAGAYDVALKDTGGADVWTRRVSPASDVADTLRTDLASVTAGAVLIGFSYSLSGENTLMEVLGRDVYPEAAPYNAVGNGTADDTAAIQAAINALTSGQTLRLTREYRITGAGLVLTNKTRIAIRGPGKLKFSGAAQTATLLRLAGTCDHIVIDGVQFEGEAISGATGFQYGVWSESDASLVLSNIHVVWCKFRNLNAGVSFNAESAGSIKHVKALHNDIADMVGVEGGQGYAIHESNAEDFEFAHNVIDRDSRHAIYCARWSGTAKWVGKVHHNTIRNHRQVGFDPTKIRVALFDVQGGVVWEENTVEDYYDGAFWAATDLANSKSNIGSVYRDNHHRRRKNIVPSVLLGEQANPSSLRLGKMVITGNDFTNDITAAGGGEEIQINNGLGVQFDENEFVLTNVPAGTYRVIIAGAYSTGVADLDLLSIKRNRATGTAVSGTPVNFVRLASAVCTTTIRARIEDNEPDEAFLGQLVEYQSTRTNAKVVVKPLGGRIVGVYTAADATPSVYGGVEMLEIVNASALNLNGLKDGTPGQKVTMIFGDGNTTVKHNVGGSGSAAFRFPSGSDITGAARKTLAVELSALYGTWMRIADSTNA